MTTLINQAIQSLRSFEVDDYFESLHVECATVIDRSGGRDIADVDDATACCLFLRWLDEHRRQNAIRKRRASMVLLKNGTRPHKLLPSTGKAPRCATLQSDSVALSGSLTPKVWTDRDGNAKPSLDLIASAVLTPYSIKKKRQAAQPEPQRDNGPRQAPTYQPDYLDEPLDF